MLHAAIGSVLLLQIRPQFAEQRRQLPAAKNIGVIERRWSPLQRAQIMVRIEDLLVFAVAARMRGDDLAAAHDVDPLDVGLDRHDLKCCRARHAVTVVVEANHLVLVGFGRLHDARIEALLGQRQRLVTLAPKAFADPLALPRLHALAVAQAAGAQVCVEFGQVLDFRDRCRPVALQVPHPPFDVRLLLRLTNHAEERLEGIVADQRLIALVEPPLPTDEQLRRHRLGIVPPQFTRHDAKELKRLDQPVQDRLGPLGWQRNREGTVGIAPGRNQHRHLPAAVREIDVDVAKVRFEPLTRIVVERDERFALRPAFGKNVLPDALVAAEIAVLLPQTADDLGDRVPLLARRLLIAAQDLVDDRLERIDHRRHDPASIGLGLGLGQDLADLPPRVMKLAGQLPNAHLVEAMGLANACVLVHLDHPPPPVVRPSSCWSW